MLRKRRKVFIDCGSNTGDTLEVFIKNWKDFRDYEVYCFEPNKLITQDYQSRFSSFKKLEVFNKAVWIREEVKNFYLGNKNRHMTNSRLEDFTVGRDKSKFRSESTKVECINFSEWLNDNFNNDDYVVLKMDIEGAEYDVLEQLIEDKTLNMVDQLYVEFHKTESAPTTKFRIDLANKISSLDVDIFGNFLGGKEFNQMFGENK